MKRCMSIVFMIILTAGTVGSAGAESIKGRLGATGRLGFIVPSDEPADAQSGFAGGGGLIFGITDILAAEADVVYASNIEFNNAQGEIRQTDVAVGLQVRNNVPDSKLTAYLGAGLDILFINNAENLGQKLDSDPAFGGHIRGGADYFLTRQLALNLDLRGSFFPDVHLTNGGTTVVYDPISFIGMAGVRVFFY